MSTAYYPKSDGATEWAKRTVTQMLRQCVAPNQRDCVQKLPAIKFAINTSCSDSTGYTLFFLNTGHIPKSFVWEHATPTKYPGVQAYAWQLKNTLVHAHDSLLEACAKQTSNANQKQQASPFSENDLVYLSSKSLTFQKD